MNKIILLFSIIFLITTQINCQMEWTDVIYHYQTGSVPPPYFFSYDFNISSDGKAKLVYRPSYSYDSSWVYDINLTNSQVNQLDSVIKTSNILNEEIPALPENKHPIGGSLQNVKIFLKQDNNLDQVPKSITTPYFPQIEYKEKLENLYEIISSFIPQDKWNEIKERKQILTK